MKRINRNKFYFYLTGILIFSNSLSYSATFWSEKYFSQSTLLFFLIIFINFLLFLFFLPIYLYRLNDAGFSYKYIFVPILNLVLLLLPSKITRIADNRDLFNFANPMGRKDFILYYPLPFLALLLLFFTTYFAFLFYEISSAGKLDLFAIILISNIIYLALHALFIIYTAFFILSLLIRRLKDINLNPFWAFLVISKYLFFAYFFEKYISENILANDLSDLIFIGLFFFLPELILAIVPSKKIKG